MGRPWWYDSYWEKKGGPPRKHRPTRGNGQHSSPPGWILTFIIIFVLMICSLVVWTLFGNQITAFFYNLSEDTLPRAAEPLPESTEPKAPITAPALPTVEPTPTAPPEVVQPPKYKREELIQYALELINRDRAAHGLVPVVVGNNDAAQKHAEERLANKHSSHWGMNGLKPYMRYTLAGGENYEAENGFMTETIWIRGKDPSYSRNPIEMLEQAQQGLMTSPGHRRNILDKWHKKVNLGIAYDEERLDLVQQFEGDYLDFLIKPIISGGILWMSGDIEIGTIENVAIYYDPLPEPLTPEQLDFPPYDYAYGLGEEVGFIVPPLPPNYFYTDLPSYAVVAGKWEIKPDGFFDIEADISEILSQGNGVYTVTIWSNIDGEFISLSNYSIFFSQ